MNAISIVERSTAGLKKVLLVRKDYYNNGDDNTTGEYRLYIYDYFDFPENEMAWRCVDTFEYEGDYDSSKGWGSIFDKEALPIYKDMIKTWLITD